MARANGTRNDIAIVYLPKQNKPLIVAVMTRKAQQNAKWDNQIVVDAAKIALQKWLK